MDGIKDTYTTQALVALIGLAKSNVLARAKREGWQSRPRHGRGGGHEWLVASMPEKTRLTLAVRLRPKTAPEPVGTDAVNGLAALPNLSVNARTRAEAKSALLLHCKVFTATAGLTRLRGLDAFASRWNAHEIDAEPWLYDAIPSVCRNTLLNWEKAVAVCGVARLGGDYGKHRRGVGLIDSQPELLALVLGMIGEFPDVPASLVMDRLRAASAKRIHAELPAFELPSMRRLQAWLSDWKQANRKTWEFLKAPDRYKGGNIPSFGDYYAHVTRYNQLWEYDGTPSDVMLADNQRYAIVGVINVYSRQLKLEVVPRSTAEAVANLTRRAILDWGVPETAVTDNGKEFVSRHMRQLLVGLGIRLDILPPFRPELKPAIERVFRSFSHHLLTLCPCYLGHNVATRQEIRERDTFARQLMKRGKDVQTTEISIAMTPEDLQRHCDEWTDKFYAHRPHDGLHGKTPYQTAQEWTESVRRIPDERALDILLVPLASGDGFRTVNKNGLHVDGRVYIAPQLGAYVRKRVQVRLDRTNPGLAYVFDESGQYVCTAEDITGMTPDRRRDIAVSARTAGRSVKSEARRLRSIAKKTGASDAAAEIREFHLARASEIESANPELSREVEAHITFELSEAARAAAGDIAMTTLTPEQAENARANARTLLETPAFAVPETREKRLVKFMELERRLMAGEAISPGEREWMESYCDSNERKGMEEMNRFFRFAQ